MEKTKTFIETEQPSLPKLIAYIDWLERGLTDKWVPKNEEDKQSDRPVLRQPYEVEEVEEELLLDQ